MKTLQMSLSRRDGSPRPNLMGNRSAEEKENRGGMKTLLFPWTSSHKSISISSAEESVLGGSASSRQQQQQQQRANGFHGIGGEERSRRVLARGRSEEDGRRRGGAGCPTPPPDRSSNSRRNPPVDAETAGTGGRGKGEGGAREGNPRKLGFGRRLIVGGRREALADSSSSSVGGGGGSSDSDRVGFPESGPCSSGGGQDDDVSSARSVAGNRDGAAPAREVGKRRRLLQVGSGHAPVKPGSRENSWGGGEEEEEEAARCVDAGGGSSAPGAECGGGGSHLLSDSRRRLVVHSEGEGRAATEEDSNPPGDLSHGVPCPSLRGGHSSFHSSSSSSTESFPRGTTVNGSLPRGREEEEEEPTSDGTATGLVVMDAKDPGRSLADRTAPPCRSGNTCAVAAGQRRRPPGVTSLAGGRRSEGAGGSALGSRKTGAARALTTGSSPRLAGGVGKGPGVGGRPGTASPAERECGASKLEVVHARTQKPGPGISRGGRQVNTGPGAVKGESGGGGGGGAVLAKKPAAGDPSRKPAHSSRRQNSSSLSLIDKSKVVSDLNRKARERSDSGSSRASRSSLCSQRSTVSVRSSLSAASSRLGGVVAVGATATRASLGSVSTSRRPKITRTTSSTVIPPKVTAGKRAERQGSLPPPTVEKSVRTVGVKLENASAKLRRAPAVQSGGPGGGRGVGDAKAKTTFQQTSKGKESCLNRQQNALHSVARSNESISRSGASQAKKADVAAATGVQQRAGVRGDAYKPQSVASSAFSRGKQEARSGKVAGLGTSSREKSSFGRQSVGGKVLAEKMGTTKGIGSKKYSSANQVTILQFTQSQRLKDKRNISKDFSSTVDFKLSLDAQNEKERKNFKRSNKALISDIPVSQVRQEVGGSNETEKVCSENSDLVKLHKHFLDKKQEIKDESFRDRDYLSVEKVDGDGFENQILSAEISENESLGSADYNEALSSQSNISSDVCMNSQCGENVIDKDCNSDESLIYYHDSVAEQTFGEELAVVGGFYELPTDFEDGIFENYFNTEGEMFAECVGGEERMNEVRDEADTAPETGGISVLTEFSFDICGDHTFPGPAAESQPDPVSCVSEDMDVSCDSNLLSDSCDSISMSEELDNCSTTVGEHRYDGSVQSSEEQTVNMVADSKMENTQNDWLRESAAATEDRKKLKQLVVSAHSSTEKDFDDILQSLENAEVETLPTHQMTISSNWTSDTEKVEVRNKSKILCENTCGTAASQEQEEQETVRHSPESTTESSERPIDSDEKISGEDYVGSNDKVNFKWEDAIEHCEEKIFISTERECVLKSLLERKQNEGGCSLEDVSSLLGMGLFKLEISMQSVDKKELEEFCDGRTGASVAGLAEMKVQGESSVKESSQYDEDDDRDHDEMSESCLIEETDVVLKEPGAGKIKKDLNSRLYEDKTQKIKVENILVTATKTTEVEVDDKSLNAGTQGFLTEENSIMDAEMTNNREEKLEEQRDTILYRKKMQDCTDNNSESVLSKPVKNNDTVEKYIDSELCDEVLPDIETAHLNFVGSTKPKPDKFKKEEPALRQLYGTLSLRKARILELCTQKTDSKKEMKCETNSRMAFSEGDIQSTDNKGSKKSPLSEAVCSESVGKTFSDSKTNVQGNSKRLTWLKEGGIWKRGYMMEDGSVLPLNNSENEENQLVENFVSESNTIENMDTLKENKTLLMEPCGNFDDIYDISSKDSSEVNLNQNIKNTILKREPGFDDKSVGSSDYDKQDVASISQNDKNVLLLGNLQNDVFDNENQSGILIQDRKMLNDDEDNAKVEIEIYDCYKENNVGEENSKIVVGENSQDEIIKGWKQILHSDNEITKVEIIEQENAKENISLKQNSGIAFPEECFENKMAEITGGPFSFIDDLKSEKGLIEEQNQETGHNEKNEIEETFKGAIFCERKQQIFSQIQENKMVDNSEQPIIMGEKAGSECCVEIQNEIYLPQENVENSTIHLETEEHQISEDIQMQYNEVEGNSKNKMADDNPVLFGEEQMFVGAADQLNDRVGLLDENMESKMANVNEQVSLIKIGDLHENSVLQSVDQSSGYIFKNDTSEDACCDLESVANLQGMHARSSVEAASLMTEALEILSDMDKTLTAEDVCEEFVQDEIHTPVANSVIASNETLNSCDDTVKVKDFNVDSNAIPLNDASKTEILSNTDSFTDFENDGDDLISFTDDLHSLQSTIQDTLSKRSMFFSDFGLLPMQKGPAGTLFAVNESKRTDYSIFETQSMKPEESLDIKLLAEISELDEISGEVPSTEDGNRTLTCTMPPLALSPRSPTTKKPYRRSLSLPFSTLPRRCLSPQGAGAESSEVQVGESPGIPSKAGRNARKHNLVRRLSDVRGFSSYDPNGEKFLCFTPSSPVKDNYEDPKGSVLCIRESNENIEDNVNSEVYDAELQKFLRKTLERPASLDEVKLRAQFLDLRSKESVTVDSADVSDVGADLVPNQLPDACSLNEYGSSVGFPSRLLSSSQTSNSNLLPPKSPGILRRMFRRGRSFNEKIKPIKTDEASSHLKESFVRKMSVKSIFRRSKSNAGAQKGKESLELFNRKELRSICNSDLRVDSADDDTLSVQSLNVSSQPSSPIYIASVEASKDDVFYDQNSAARLLSLQSINKSWKQIRRKNKDEAVETGILLVGSHPAGASGSQPPQPLSPQELEKLAALVRGEMVSSNSSDSGIQHDSSLQSSSESLKQAIQENISTVVHRKAASPSRERPKSDITVRWAALLEEVTSFPETRWQQENSQSTEHRPRPKSDLGGSSVIFEAMKELLCHGKLSHSQSQKTVAELKRTAAANNTTGKSRRMSTPHPIKTRIERSPPKQAKKPLLRSHSMPDSLSKLHKKRHFCVSGSDPTADLISQPSTNDDSSDESEVLLDYGLPDKCHSTQASQAALTMLDEIFEEENLTYAEALWDHVTMDPDELPFRAGDVIKVTDMLDKDWWWGALLNKEGWFPAAFVRLRANQEQLDDDVAEKFDNNLNDSPPGMRRYSVSCLNKDQARTNVINEIINAEREYVKHLKDVVEGYIRQARKRPDMFPEEKITTIFGNLEEIYTFSSKFLQQLENSLNLKKLHLSDIGQCFIEHKKGFEIYSDYCNNHPQACTELKDMCRNKRIKHFFEGCRLLQEMIEIPLEGFLLTPVQKICKYPLQLAELFKYTQPEHGDYLRLCEALDAMKKIATLINERKRRMESIEKIAVWQHTVEDWEGPDLLETSSELIYSGELSKVNSSGWTQERYFFLFDHQLIYCKKDLLKKNVFSFRGRINLDHTRVFPINDGRDGRFNVNVKNGWKLHDSKRDKWFLVFAKNAVEKDRWLKAFEEERKKVKDDQENGFTIPVHIRKSARNSFRMRSQPDKPKEKELKKTLNRMSFRYQQELWKNIPAHATLPRGFTNPTTLLSASQGKKRASCCKTSKIFRDSANIAIT